MLAEPVIDALFQAVQTTPGYRLTVDRRTQTVSETDRERHAHQAFEIDPSNKSMLLEGLDEIGVTLRHAADIAAFKRKRRALEPWLASGVRLLSSRLDLNRAQM